MAKIFSADLLIMLKSINGYIVINGVSAIQLFIVIFIAVIIFITIFFNKKSGT
jgi:hypothetical protein